MAVPVHKRKESDLQFLINAENLQQKTHDAVMNEDYVPKKYRYIWTQEIFRKSMEIYENARKANEIYPRDEATLKKRLYLLLKAQTDAEALKGQISFARRNFNIPSGTLKEWEKLCVDTKNSLKRRREKDFKRFEKELK